MGDQVIAAIITGVAAIIAALIGVRRLWERQHASDRLLTENDRPPIFAGAKTFAKRSTLAEQKKLIQGIEIALSRGSLTLSRTQMERCDGSDWELDRIGLYLFEEYTAQSDHRVRVLHVQHEFERIRSVAHPQSWLPLHYAIRSLHAMVRQHPGVVRSLYEHGELVQEIGSFLRKQPQLDPRGETQQYIHKLGQVLHRNAA